MRLDKRFFYFPIHHAVLQLFSRLKLNFSISNFSQLDKLENWNATANPVIHHFSDAVYPSSSSLYHHYNHELGSDFHNPALCNGSSRSLEAWREGRVTDLLPDFQFSFIEFCSMEILMHFPLERPFLRCTYIFIEILVGIYSKTR